MHLICIAVASFAVLAQPAGAQGTNTTLPLTYSTQVFHEDGNQTCLSEEQKETARIWIKNAAKRLLQQSVVSLPQTFSCGGSTGWRRVAYLDMSDPSEHCPSVWQEITTPHRVCGRRSTGGGSCEGLNYSTGSAQYNQVCGRIIGYQIGVPGAFTGSDKSVNTSYVDGVSVTHGSPRQHIWTFAAGYNEQPSAGACICVAGSTNENYIPSFVGQNYFCESGIPRFPGYIGFWSDGDPLWDGQGCGLTSSCCTFHSPPWFNVQLPSPTTDDIEVRICADGGSSSEDSPIQFVELYVK